MRQVIKVETGKAILDTSEDTRIYQSPLRCGNGNHATRGADLFVHTTKKGLNLFYEYRWTRWQGETDQIIPVTKEEAEQFLVDRSDDVGDGEADTAAQYGINLFEETA